MTATVIASPVTVRPSPPAAYDPKTRPHFLDGYWDYAFGSRFVTSQGTVQTTLSAPTTVNGNSITVTDATGILALMALIIFPSPTTGVYGPYQVVVVSSVSGSTITLSNVTNQVFAAGCNVYGVWLNDAHLNGFALLGQWIADQKMRPHSVGSDLLPLQGITGFTIGQFPTWTGGANAVPDGWAAINSPVFLQIDWSNSSAVVNQNGRSPRTGTHACDCRWNSGATNGMQTAAAITVAAGQRVTVTAWLKFPTSAGSVFKVVDHTTPTLILASYTSVLGDGNLGKRVPLSFVVPAGTTGVDIVLIPTVGDVIISDVRVIRSRQDADQDRYVIEDPGQRPIVLLGDSWGTGMGGNYGRNDDPGPGTLQHSLQLRLRGVVYADGVTTNTSTALRSTTAKFAASDVGNSVSSAGLPSGTTMAAVVSPSPAASGGLTPAAAWAATTAYAIGSYRRPTTANGHLYVATVAGTSGGSEPVWPTDGTTVVDGTVTWQDTGTANQVTLSAAATATATSVALTIVRNPIVFYNVSVSGQTLAQMLTRFNVEVAPLKPAYVIHASAFMNDSGRTSAAVQADVADLVDRCRQIGSTPVLLGAFNQNSAIATMGPLNDNIRARVDQNQDFVPWAPAAV